MSIYCSALVLDADDHTEACQRWVPVAGGVAAEDWQMCTGDGHFRRDDSKPCTCQAGPIVYEGSHILPADGDPRGGVFDLGEIPGFIWSADRPALCNEDRCPTAADCCDRVWPWLRVSVNAETVVLDLAQVRRVHEYLGRWLSHTADADVEVVDVG